jgi:Domain of unknown function (DUF1735)/Domain of unknown function (DUF4361)
MLKKIIIMMRHIKYGKYIIAMVLLFSFSSCLKKDDIPNLSKVDPVIEFPIGGPGLLRNTLAAFSTDVVDTVIALNIASPDPLDRDITVTIKNDPAVVAAYNTANGTTYEAPSATQVEIPNTQITIKAGYRVGKVRVKVKFPQFDPNKSYMLGLSIVDAPGMIISGNFGKFLWAFVVRNPYEGQYQETGQITLYNGATVGSGVAAVRTFNRPIAATTVNGVTLQTLIADLGNFMNLTINSVTNNVTVSPGSTNSFTIVENNGSCTYNPATKTLVLNFRYFNGAGNLREIVQTMVRQ